MMLVSGDPAPITAGLTDVMAGPTTVKGVAEEVTLVVDGLFTTVRPSTPAAVRSLLGIVAVMDVAVPAVTVIAVGVPPRFK